MAEREQGTSIRRALKVLSAFSLEESFLGVSEIAKKLGLPRSSVHWLLQVLQDEGYVCQDPKSGKYRLSVKLFYLGTIAANTINISYVARPVMERLRDLTEETVNLYVLDGFDRVCIEQAEGIHLVRQVVRLGQKIPSYCGAAGKVLIAWQPEDFIERLISHTRLKPLTKNTISDAGLFKEELAKIRRQGYAVSFGERDVEVAAVAAPVFDEEGKILASLSVSGPVSRFEITPQVVEAIINAASEISYQLGYSKDLETVTSGGKIKVS